MNSISVVIPTLHEEGYVGQILADLRIQTLQPKEVIVVDGGSTDGTHQEILKYKDVRLVVREASVSEQRNAGAYAATGDIVVFLDADTRIESNFLEKMLKAFELRGLDVACPLYVPYQSTFMTHAIFWYVNVVFILLQGILPSGAGPCIMVKREIFLKERGFIHKQNFEDMEWVRRVGKKYRFGVLFEKVAVSDRRFRTYGMFRMIVLYILISFLFTFGLFSLANKVRYTFGGYKKRAVVKSSAQK